MEEKSRHNSKTTNVLSFRKYLSRLKKLFRYWIIAAIIIGLLSFIFTLTGKIFTGKISTMVNFSFDGIELGIDPNGNKFDVNNIKSEEVIKKSLEDLGYTDKDPELIAANISIDGIIPENVIERITHYTPNYGENIVSSKSIADTSYYPTQYKIELRCENIGMNKKSAAKLLNKITENYNQAFYNSYGYNPSLESAVMAIDYKEYDYVDAVDVFTSSLKSLQNYINELAAKDTLRFRSEKGYTFSDISASIDTVCNEDLDIISSYIMSNNVTKDKKTLIANYEFKIENLKRQKKSAQEMLDSIGKTIETYEKDSIIIYGNTSDSQSASITQSSDAYNELISQKISAQSTLSSCDQNINLYNKRIASLNSSSLTASYNEYVEKEFERISSKVNSLLETTNETASEYYEKVLLNNAYSVLSEANPSILQMIKEAISELPEKAMAFELLLTAVYLTASVVFCFVSFPNRTKKKSSKDVKKTDKKNKRRSNVNGK